MLGLLVAVLQTEEVFVRKKNSSSHGATKNKSTLQHISQLCLGGSHEEAAS